MIYIPLTANAFTQQHKKAIRILVKEDFIRIGLLDGESCRPFEQRKNKIEKFVRSLGDEAEDIIVVSQVTDDSLANAKKHNCDFIVPHTEKELINMFKSDEEIIYLKKLIIKI